MYGLYSPVLQPASDIVMAYIVMACIVMAYIVMVYIVMAYIFMAYIVRFFSLPQTCAWPCVQP